jgi:hypothetical protein
MISFSTAAMEATRVLILKLHIKGTFFFGIFRMLKQLNVNLRFMGRTFRRYKETSQEEENCSPRLIRNSSQGGG